MATRASAEVTITDETDATALVPWYYASTSAIRPDQPTTTQSSDIPTGWSMAEPTVSSSADLSKSVWSCMQLVWGDGTCSWGEVTLSASFEAAKVAYNEAQAAKATATSYFTDTTNGVIVHGAGGDGSTGWRIQDLLEMLINGQSLIQAGLVGGRPSIRVGPESGGMHLNVTSDRLAFCDAGGAEVAYIAVDSGNNSKLYISEAVVMSELNFGEGKWTWRKRENDNLSLKWTGA